MTQHPSIPTTTLLFSGILVFAAVSHSCKAIGNGFSVTFSASADGDFIAPVIPAQATRCTLVNCLTETGIVEEQQGFRSAVYDIFILRLQLVEKAIEYKKPAFLCFIDLTKAFDKIRLKDVIKILDIDCNVIRNLNIENTTSVKTNNEISTSIPVATGIRQGDSLSPILFNLIMDELTSAIKSTQTRAYWLGYEVKAMMQL